MSELWWANAFVGEVAGGNATGVVIGAAPDEAGVARDLRAPDTVFIDGDALRFYSPYEGRMAFCGQALLAADAVLRRGRLLLDARGTDVEVGGVVTLVARGALLPIATVGPR